MFSIIHQFKNGRSVELATVGNEGLVGLPVFLGGDEDPNPCVVQVGGTAVRAESQTIVRVAERSPAFRRVVMRYAQAFILQVGQTAACNATHDVESRCARWLLMTQDRVRRDRIELSEEFLAFMLGIARSGVTVVVRHFEEIELVSSSPTAISILNRAALEAASCECYEQLRQNSKRFLETA